MITALKSYEQKYIEVPNEYSQAIEIELSLFSEAIELGAHINRWVTLPNFPDSALPYLEALLGVLCI